MSISQDFSIALQMMVFNKHGREFHQMIIQMKRAFAKAGVLCIRICSQLSHAPTIQRNKVNTDIKMKPKRRVREPRNPHLPGGYARFLGP
jgi:hypothetical protein